MLDIIFFVFIIYFFYIRAKNFITTKKSQETDLCPHNRHSHRADAIHCLPTEILYGRGAPRHDRSLLATTLHQNIKRRTLKPKNGL